VRNCFFFHWFNFLKDNKLNFIILKEYYNKYEAQMDIVLLKNNKINALLISDDLGGLRPHLALSTGIKIQVSENDYAMACKIIDKENL